MVRPTVLYRAEFRQLVLAEQPSKVLEVGCGDGECLRELRRAGVDVVGLEVDARKVATANAAGLPVQQGDAEVLPFADGTFDLVISEYSAHHFANLRRHFAEALRVARRGVFLLDPWYDASVPAQRTAWRWDRWCKAIDRAAGMVHHDVLDAGGIHAALPPDRELTFECRHWLRLAAFDLATFDSESAEYLARARDPAGAAAELGAIRADIAEHGLADDGAIVALVRTLP
jgi:SAM-dependent methyltransferase